jgi:hypothetical protein
MRLLVQFALLAPLTAGFIFPSQKRKPGLKELVEAQQDVRVNINLDIGGKDDTTRLAVSGMVFDLTKNTADYEHVAMPGTNGPHPQLSSGIRGLNLIKEGQFVSLKGTQLVKTLKGCWELIWKKDAPAGAVLCGFDIPEEYTRNDATLPKGRIYMSFPVWTQDTLNFAQKKKEGILKRAEECLQEKQACLDKYKTEKNPFQAALHYRNAYAAAEKYYMQPLKSVMLVPEMSEVIEIQDDLFLMTKGLVWSKALPRGPQVLLGTATLSPGTATFSPGIVTP